MSVTWKKMTCFAFDLPDRPGELANVLQELYHAGINLLGLWGHAPGSDEPRLSCVPESPAAFRTFFRSAGLGIEEGYAFYLSAENRRGALVETLQRIAAAGINIDAVESVASGELFGCFIWTGPDQWDALEALLG